MGKVPTTKKLTRIRRSKDYPDFFGWGLSQNFKANFHGARNLLFLNAELANHLYVFDVAAYISLHSKQGRLVHVTYNYALIGILSFTRQHKISSKRMLATVKYPSATTFLISFQ